MTKQSMCATLLMSLVLTLWCWKTCHCDPPHPEVRLGYTIITGLHTTVAGDKPVRKFLGIRYGQAPTGPQRFKPPLRAELPPKVNAQRYGARCPQGTAYRPGMSEDCLFLNVFVPGRDTSDQLPVLVWIHGGGFLVGAADVYEAEELAGEGDIVVVTLNYRLGALGFLSTGDDSSPGNYGLWDQRLALQWVQEHIYHFGGDKTRVTLAGVSAGGASASLHALSPLSRDLFRHVIQLSGSATAPWARVSSAEALETAKTFGQDVGCQPSEHNVSTLSLVSCLRGRSVESIVASGVVVFPDEVGRSLVDFVWGPVEDGSLVTDVNTAATFPGPVLAGLVNNEGDTLLSWSVPRISPGIPDLQALLRDRQFYTQQFLPTLLKQAYPEMVPLPWPTRNGREGELYAQPPYLKALQGVRCAYRGEEGGGGEVVEEDELREVYGDQGFVLGTVRFLERFCGHQSCFLYFVDYQTDRPGITGIRHLDDLVFLFGFNTTLARKLLGFEGHMTDLDLQLSRDLRQLFVNFIKTGDPNSPESPQGWPLWTPYTSKGANYLHVSPSPSVLSHLKADKMALWLEDIPRILSSAGNVSDRWQCQMPASSGHTVLLAVRGNALLMLMLLLSGYICCGS